ncbi:hypothetical protein [Bacillus phage SP8]|uniref:Uncharacterized protein n=1 Tax=Bacillus phage Adastra TaxID=3143958 RepID=A0AAU8BCH6_9CAUD|nr:hypothetical protein [Bacillus phage SP8]
MLFKYIHDVNAKVEEGRRYLSDVVRVALDKEETKDPDTQEVLSTAYRVTAYPVVQVGEEEVPYIPVHPKTAEPGQKVTVPVYDVPEELPILVRGRNPEATGDYDDHIWVTEMVKVSPIVDEVFGEDDFEKARLYYEDVAAQLAEGDDIRHYFRKDLAREAGHYSVSRYPSF